MKAMTKKFWVLVVMHPNGWVYVSDETGMNPRFNEAKRFDGILEVQAFREKYWNDFEAKLVEVTCQLAEPIW